MILEEPTQWPLLYPVLLKGPVKHADKARHGDLMVQKKKNIKIFPAVKKNTCKHLLRVTGEPLSLSVMSSHVSQFCSSFLCGCQSAFFFTEFGL